MSYATEAEYRAYFLARDINVTAQTTTEVDAALLIATEYLDDNYDFVGVRVSEDQANKWPRTGAYNYEGILLDQVNVPTKVKNATCELAYIEITQTGGLEPLPDGLVEKKVKTRLGTLEKETEYDTAKSQNYIRSYNKAIKMIDDLIVRGQGSSLILQRVI